MEEIFIFKYLVTLYIFFGLYLKKEIERDLLFYLLNYETLRSNEISFEFQREGSKEYQSTPDVLTNPYIENNFSYYSFSTLSSENLTATLVVFTRCN